MALAERAGSPAATVFGWAGLDTAEPARDGNAHIIKLLTAEGTRGWETRRPGSWEAGPGENPKLAADWPSSFPAS